MISWAFIGVGIGAGLTVLGAAIGIGRIGGQTVEGISRQPEASFLVSMIIPAALIEGVALFGLVIMFLLAGKIDKDILEKFATGGGAHRVEAKAPK